MFKFLSFMPLFSTSFTNIPRPGLLRNFSYGMLFHICVAYNVGTWSMMQSGIKSADPRSMLPDELKMWDTSPRIESVIRFQWLGFS